MSSHQTSSRPTSSALVLFLRIPTMLFLGLGILGVFVLFEPSAEPDVFIFSYFRAIALCFMALLGLYAALSLRVSALISFNNHIFYTGVLGVFIVEVALRVVPSLIPDELVYLLPENDRKSVAMQRGLFTEQALSGEGMLFHWKPNLTFAQKPWMKIDADGYRNRNLPQDQTDVVILGASIPLAETVPFDLVERFIQAEHTAYSLAMSSYAPQHYRDAYRYFVINRKIRHKAVIVLVVPKYDLEKAISYERVTQSSGDYKNYLRPAPILNYGVPGIDRLWTLSILNGLPTKLIYKIKLALNSKTVPIRLDWATIDIPENVFIPRDIPPGWAPFTMAIKQIISDVREHGAVPFIVLYPGIAARLLPYAELKASIASNFKHYNSSQNARIAKFVKNAGGRFINVTEIFRNRSKENVLTDNPLGIHLNQAGVDLLYEAILPEIKKDITR